MRPSTPATGSRGRDGALERAVLVGVDLVVRSRGNHAAQAGARQAAVRVEQDSADFALNEDAIDNPAGAGVSAARVAASRSSTELDTEESLAEFRELVASAGGVVAAELLQRRARPDPARLIGAGKVEEIAGIAASVEADLVLFDHDLTPTQLRNLEAALPCRVLDRTQLILDIFARHARTREMCIRDRDGAASCMDSQVPNTGPGPPGRIW